MACTLTDTREDAALGHTKEETSNEEAGHALHNAQQRRDDTEDDCEGRKPEPRRRTFKDDVACRASVISHLRQDFAQRTRDFEEHVTDEEQR